MSDKTLSKAELMPELPKGGQQTEKAANVFRAIRRSQADAPPFSQNDRDTANIAASACHACRLLAEELEMGYAILDREGIILFSNTNFAKIVGRPPETMAGQSLARLLPDFDWHSLQEALAGRQGRYRREMIIKASDGRSVPLLASAARLELAAGLLFCLFITDLTEQKRAEKLINLILKQAAEAIVVCDRNGKITRANMAAQRLLGKDLILKSFDDAVPLYYGTGSERFYIHHALAGEMCGVQVRFQAGGGYTLYFVLSAGRVAADLTDDVCDIAVVLTDVTENHRLIQEMQRLDRLNLVGEMAASIGHEVRNPLTTVRGFLQIFKDKPQFSPYRDTFCVMIEEIDRANSIITEFLALAKNKNIELLPVNLNKIISAIFPLIQADAFHRGNYVEANLGDIPLVLGDEREIIQCLLNLVRNGLEAMQNGGKLTITTHAQNNRVILVVKDEGSGIPREIINKIGTPFFTSKENGTGLGLSICYSIARRHQAKIDFETGPQGTTFYVNFHSALI